jgi:glutaredoxin-like protein NrdH
MINIYTVPNCKHCVKAKEFLEKHNVPYTEINLREKDNRTARDFYRSIGATSAPVITSVNGDNIEWILAEYNEDVLNDLIS